jgi:hypothetical protein
MFADFHQFRSTRRVELNAMTSPQFVAFVERKVREARIEKIVPDDGFLASIYAGMERGRRLEKEVASLKVDKKASKPPPRNLQQRIRKVQKKDPALRWDAVLARIVSEKASAQGGRTGRTDAGV